MKKFAAFLILVGFICSGIVAQSTSSISVSDYFPTELLGSWTYANAAGKEYWTVFVKNRTHESSMDIAVFETQIKGLGSTVDIYGIKYDRVMLLSSKGIWSDYYDYPEPYLTILATPNKTWRENDRGDDLAYQTIATSCKFDNKVFNDCICVIETLSVNNSVKRIKKNYYANGIGLVCVTIKGEDGKDGIYMKLTESTFLKE